MNLPTDLFSQVSENDFADSSFFHRLKKFSRCLISEVILFQHFPFGNAKSVQDETENPVAHILPFTRYRYILHLAFRSYYCISLYSAAYCVTDKQQLLTHISNGRYRYYSLQFTAINCIVCCPYTSFAARTPHALSASLSARRPLSVLLARPASSESPMLRTPDCRPHSVAR